MGGNAFSGLSRINSADHKALCDMIKLSCPSVKLKVIDFYKNKKDHGDIDILYIGDITPFIKDYDHIVNGPTTSVKIPYNNSCVQVDFIYSNEDEIEFSFKYFSYNDLGNLIGRIFHKAGFKFGHDGLWYIIRVDNHVHGKVCVSRDFNRVLQLIELYNYDSFEFNELQDVFEFVVSSPYFNPSIFSLENRNHISRTRDRKRKTYMEFLAWLKSEDYKRVYQQYLPKKFNSKSYLLSRAKAMFPEFDKRLVLFEKEQERIAIIKEKFNGELAMEWTGLSGRELGKFMVYIRSILDEKDFISMSKEEIASVCKSAMNHDYFRKYIHLK